MNDTIVIYRQAERAWPDGERSPEDFVAVVLHQKPFEPVQPNRAPDAGSDRTSYLGNRTRADAIAALVEHGRCRYRHQSGWRCVRSDEHRGPHRDEEVIPPTWPAEW